jgi:DDE superfamily endonuclease
MDLPPLLLQTFLALTEGWRPVFTQHRLLRRAQHQALGALLVLGRATLSRILWTNGREQCSWSADYFLHARAKWDPQQLFAPLLKEALRYCPGRLIGVAVDDTRVRKTGPTIVQAAYHRDPLSPPFHTNLILALRFLQASLLLPLHRLGEFSARAIPIRFEEVSTVKKPGKRADAAARAQYRQDLKRFNLSQRFVASMAAIRAALDYAGAVLKILVIAGDATFCNRTALRGLPERTELIARTRKDASLCLPALGEGRRIYSAHKFTPEQVRQDPAIPGIPPRSSMAASAA